MELPFTVTTKCLPLVFLTKRLTCDFVLSAANTRRYADRFFFGIVKETSDDNAFEDASFFCRHFNAALPRLADSETSLLVETHVALLGSRGSLCATACAGVNDVGELGSPGALPS